MKRNIKKALLAFISLGIFAAHFSSCSGVIFDEIRKEVKLKDAEVGGFIQNIVRYTLNGEECIFVANGDLYYRSVEDDVVSQKIDFVKFPKPNGYVYSLAADSSNLYAFSATYSKDDDGYNTPSRREIWCFNGSSWNCVWYAPYNEYIRVSILCTNDVAPSNREAYFCYETAVYELSDSPITIGTTTPTGYLTSDSDIKGSALSEATPENLTKVLRPYSCAKIDGTTLFSTNAAMVVGTDGTVYSANRDYVWYKKSSDSDWTLKDLNCGYIMSLAITNDYLIAGTNDGIVHTPLINGVPSGELVSFQSNAESCLSSYYQVPTILVVNPDETELSATIFASSITESTRVSRKNVGLWSYFPNSLGWIGEWNRE